jgi:hypothetical protein
VTATDCEITPTLRFGAQGLLSSRGQQIDALEVTARWNRPWASER